METNVNIQQTSSSLPTAVSTIVDQETQQPHEQVLTKEFGLIPIPNKLRYDPQKPSHFGTFLNIYFAFATTFTVANLYYCQPLLIQFSVSFNVTYNQVSRYRNLRSVNITPRIPTLIQAGYAVGLVLISPLGDLVRRRQLILVLVFSSASLTIGLATTSTLKTFSTLCFLVGMVSVTPQILLPLAADLAPPERRASAISILISGHLFGLLLARVLAGVIAQFTRWQAVYYMAIGVQYLVLVGCYFVIPDYPSKNKDLTYCDIIWSMAKFSVTEPLLIQACLIIMASSACFTNFWVTLTFLLGGPLYNYSTLAIGLFGLVGMLGVATAPLVGRLIDRLVLWYASLISIIALILFQFLQLGAGGLNISAVILVCFALDVFRQMLHVSLTSAALGISAQARARLNSLLILSLFIGQVVGTSVGTAVFIKHGWRAGAGLSVGWYGWQLILLLLRGPHCKRYTWFGWEGGFEARKSVVEERKKENEREDEMGEEKKFDERSSPSIPGTEVVAKKVVEVKETNHIDKTGDKYVSKKEVKAGETV